MPGWSDLSATWQDALICLALLGPGVVAGLVVLRGFAPWALVAAFLRRFVWTNLLFVILIAASVASEPPDNSLTPFRSPGATSARRFASRTATGFEPCMGGEKLSRSICSLTASMTRRFACPTPAT